MTWPNDEAIENAIRVLNEALAADPVAVKQLMSLGVEVNTEALRDHPTIQVGSSVPGGPVVLRPLGLVNGLLGARDDGWGFVAAVTDDAGDILGFFRYPGGEEK